MSNPLAENIKDVFSAPGLMVLEAARQTAAEEKEAVAIHECYNRIKDVVEGEKRGVAALALALLISDILKSHPYFKILSNVSIERNDN